MEIEVRVVRARVWLSSSLFLHQDGFLSLTRVGGKEHVAHATLRSVEGKSGGQCSLADVVRQQGQQKCFRTVTVAWEEQAAAPGSNCPRFSLPEAPGDGPARVKRNTNQQPVLPRLDFQLFLLRPRSRGGTSARSRPQTVYVGTSGWQLSDKDVQALASSREVVFLATLQNDLGTLEVKLRDVGSSNGAGQTAVKDPAAESEADAPTGFNINWSSSEALQKDLAEKARLKAEADKKLIAQLKMIATKTAKFLESRDILLIHLHRSRAASKIQRRFRALLHKRQEVIAKLRQEEEDRIAAKKAKVRDKVIARNRQRALAMRARLLEHIDNNHRIQDASPEDSTPLQEAKRIAEHVEIERAKLRERLAILEMQRQQLATSARINAARSNQHSLQQRSEKLLDDELVRAVQQLHFNSNQM
ncbi:hypothetical protein PF005_g10016 [Phytophthora fragariae]|uniref:Uncharacterized protein n=1 Tax=Phytophthora fragariae TaxID=53985 RepID=A0A6A4DUD0_9STRA|nr:hypothetical protein PF003_g24953 [Phytophthora fragariae]KAE8939064.1 hypothetical protein PF009_g11077 [Phytophthora fragariae]KAE9012115.1 hypothetical protein PF011_g9065 [Phytophthora fragariae]KAE9115142.1 hypothetical protein PF007_g10130 [Phytophthora fragariae]KAE9115532.1 hypothetical protein PF010_g9290 [Phytophthora fragariae]